MLHDFRKTGEVLPLFQRPQDFQVHIDQAGHLERANHVLISVKIHPRLAADAAVRLGQKRGGNLHIVDSPQEGGRRVSRDIACDAAPKGQKHVLAVESLCNQEFIDILHRVQGLVLLAAGEHMLHRLAAFPLQQAQQLFPVQFVHLGIRDDAQPLLLTAQRVQLLPQRPERLGKHDIITGLLVIQNRHSL